MNTADTNSDTQTKIQTSKPGGSDNFTSNQGYIVIDQGTNRDNRHNERVQTRRTEASVNSRSEIRAVTL